MRHVAILILIGMSVHAGDLLADSTYDILVMEIIESPQSYDGEMRVKLVELGPEAVPAMGKALRLSVRFPIVLVGAIGDIGSDIGVEPLLYYLQTRAPFANHDVLSIATVLSLKRIGSARVCQPLLPILEDGGADASIRLAAARSISHVCAISTAQDFVLNAHRTLMDHKPGESTPYFQNEVLLGLIDVNNDESNAILIKLLDFEGDTQIYVSIIDHLGKNGGEEIAQALLNVVGRENFHEYPIRVAALRALVRINSTSTSILLSSATRLVKQGERDGWRESDIREVELITTALMAR